MNYEYSFKKGLDFRARAREKPCISHKLLLSLW